MIFSWCVSILILIISISLLMGKGSFLIAGYNTASAEEKARYDKEKLCRVVGLGLLLISIMLMICSYYKFEMPNYLAWIVPYGCLGVVLIIIVLANTICKSKQ